MYRPNLLPLLVFPSSVNCNLEFFLRISNRIPPKNFLLSTYSPNNAVGRSEKSLGQVAIQCLLKEKVLLLFLHNLEGDEAITNPAPCTPIPVSDDGTAYLSECYLLYT